MKKAIFIFLIGAALLLTGCNSWKSTENQNVNPETTWWKCEDKNCNNCMQKGGEIFSRSFGSNCEIKAEDSGKNCTYNDECNKNICVYPDVDSSQGSCADFEGKEGRQCSRERGEDVACYMDVS